MSTPDDLRTVTLIPCRRPAGMLRVQLSPKTRDTLFKDRADWLLEGLNAYRSHRAGYCLTPRKAEQFQKLYAAGFHARRRIVANDKNPVTFSLPGGPELTLKEALKLCTP